MARTHKSRLFGNRWLNVRVAPESGHTADIAGRLKCADFVAEVGDGRGKLRLGAELPLAPLKRWL
jgi:hypothetical protein